MSLSSTVYLGSLRVKAQQKADLENSPNLTTAEWNGLINDGWKELFDLMLGAYGNDYFINNPLTPYQFNLTGVQYYSLPPDFYKLIGVDLQYSGSPSGWVTLKRFEEIERNKYAFPNTSVNFLGYTNLKYRISGNFIEFVPAPMAGQLIQLKYSPEPTNLQFEPICSTTVGSRVINSSDTTNVAVGMNCYGPGIPNGATVVSVDTNNNTVSILPVALATQSAVVLYFWTDGASVDGISGWERFIIYDAAINAGIKQESVLEDLVRERDLMRARLESMAEARDMGQAMHVSDALGANGYFDGCYGNGSFGNDWF